MRGTDSVSAGGTLALPVLVILLGTTRSHTIGVNYEMKKGAGGQDL